MREFKTSLYQQFARVGHALASPARIEILDLLSQGEKTVEELAAAASLGLKNTSAHLRTLRQARLVETRKESPYVYYRLAGERVFGMLRELQGVAHERLAEVEHAARHFLEDRDDVEPVTADDLRRRMRDGEVIVLDVRPAQEYHAGHIRGALSVPLADLENRLQELDRDREIVAYCRGPYCVYAVEAVEVMRRHGFRARRMETGFPDWRHAGHPVAVGERD